MGPRSLLSLGAALLGAAAPAQAGVLTADRASDRNCSRAPLPHSAPSADRSGLTPRSDGLLTLRLDGGRGDWDLALFDAASRRRLSAGSTSGPREVATAAVRGGRPLIIQACRRRGPVRAARFTRHFHRLPAVGPAPVRLVEVQLSLPGDRARLEAAGLDVTHAGGPDRADVVLHSAADAARLARLGLRWRVRVADLAVRTLRDLAAAAPGPSGLPSGRTSYRTLAEYQEDSKALAADHPGLVRLLQLGSSVEGRAIEGVEIAAGVQRPDGRPVLLVLGLYHAREWPSGEIPMEWATDLARAYGDDPRVTALLTRLRVVVVPVVNPDGFDVSRSAPGVPELEAGAYKRKNCRPASAIPCALRPGQGVDLNRNHGAYWGGTGSSGNPGAATYRGPAPYSEPEAEALHRLSSSRPVVTVVSHHTYTTDGAWLRQPGFCLEPPAGCDAGDVVPDEAGMAALGDAMAEATGWRSLPAWSIGEVTGATEDWNYFATGAYGYTAEHRGQGFHPPFADAVAAEYRGVREGLLRAAAAAADPASHAVLRGRAEPGTRLELSKRFGTPTSLPGIVVPDRLELSTVVGLPGGFELHVGPSTRPLAASREAYRLSCETADGAISGTQEVVVGRGEALDVGTLCGPDGAAGMSVTVARLSARRLNRRRGLRLGLEVEHGPLDRLTAELVRVRDRRPVARARVARVPDGASRVRLKRLRRVRPGRHVLRLRALDPAGGRVTTRRAVRVRP